MGGGHRDERQAAADGAGTATCGGRLEQADGGELPATATSGPSLDEAQALEILRLLLDQIESSDLGAHARLERKFCRQLRIQK